MRDLRPTVMIVDRCFGVRAVMDLLKEARAMASRTSIILWSGALTEAEALRFLQAGAMGVIRKTAPLDLLVHCIQTVASGNTWMEQEMIRGIRRPIRLA